MRESNAPVTTGDDTDTSADIWPVDCHEDMQQLSDEQLLAALRHIDADKAW